MDNNIREELEEFIKKTKEGLFKEIESNWSGRGLVFLSGGPVYLTNAYMNIKFIRKNLNCDLPIEIWYFGEKEKNKRIFSAIKKLKNIDFKDVYEHQKKFPMKKSTIENITPIQSPATVEGWRNKIYCIIHSKFKEAIYLDSDCFLFEPPDVLFEMKEFKEKRAIFSCDIDLNYKISGRSVDPETFILPKLGAFYGRGKWDYSKPNPIWKILDIEEDELPEFEAGFVMVDKANHSEPLFTTLFLNENNDFTYKYVYGDKDTFHLAWAKHKSSCHMIKKVKRSNDHISSYIGDKLLFEHRVYNTKFNPFVSWEDFPNKNPFNEKEIFKKYFLEITKIKLI